MTLQRPTPAFPWKRVAAGALDLFVTWLLLWPTILLVMFGDVDNEIEFTRSGVGAYFPFIAFMGLWLFPFCLRDVVRGRSLGKWLLAIRVVDSSDMTSTPSTGRLILRNVTIWFSPVGMVSAYLNSDRMRFGDRLAGTMVVEEPADTKSLRWRNLLFKGVVFAGVLIVCLKMASVLMTWYFERSKVNAIAVAFLDRCEPLTELLGGPPTGALKLNNVACAATDKGALARLWYSGRSPRGGFLSLVVMERGMEKGAGWHGAFAALGFDPGVEAGKIENATLNATALKFLREYKPLGEEVQGLSFEKMPLKEAGYSSDDNGVTGRLFYDLKAEGWSARFDVAMVPDNAIAWRVKEASGMVEFGPDAQGKRKAFAFLLSKGFHRYLSAEEMTKVYEKKMPLQDVVPELKGGSKDAGDNATVAPAPVPADNGSGRK